MENEYRPSELMTYEQVAKALGVSVSTARRLRARKVLRAVAIGHRTIRFRPVDVDRAIANLAGDGPRER